MSVIDQFDKTSLRVGFGDIELIVRDSHFTLRQRCRESGHCAVVMIEKEQWQSFLNTVQLANQIAGNLEKGQ